MDWGVIWPMRQILYRFHTLLWQYGTMAMELYFYFKITHFGPALDLEWHLEEASMASGHVLGWIGV